MTTKDLLIELAHQINTNEFDDGCSKMLANTINLLDDDFRGWLCDEIVNPN